MSTRLSRMAAIAVPALLIAAAPLRAQTKLDRTGAATADGSENRARSNLDTTKLANGAELIVTPKRDLPLVSFSITFIGGTSQFEPADKTGLANLTTSMLREGTMTRTGDQLSDALELLGVGGFGVFIGSESGTVSFESTKSKFAPTLDVLADVLLHPSFPADAVERLRGQTLVQLTQAKDQPTVIANNVFLHVLYGDGHPYGHVQTEASVRAITRDDVVAFHRAYFQPGRAVISVDGRCRSRDGKDDDRESIRRLALGREPSGVFVSRGCRRRSRRRSISSTSRRRRSPCSRSASWVHRAIRRTISRCR